jgi:hypothetical protein
LITTTRIIPEADDRFGWLTTAALSKSCLLNLLVSGGLVSG